MKRRAYIGLSSPTAYYFDIKKEYFFEPWLWNPILESPQGLITLFDELWFLTRSLCPITLRNLSFVKFLDEDSDFIPLLKALNNIFEHEQLEGLKAAYPFIGDILNLNGSLIDNQRESYNNIIKNVYNRLPWEDLPIDNHSHQIDLCGLKISGNSMRLDLLAYDIAFLFNSGILNIELITNRFNSIAFKQKPSTINKLQIAQGITIKRVPVLQSPTGPIIARIESIRENNFLIDFRQKILESNDPENFSELIENIENEFQKYRNNVLIQNQRNCRLGTSLVNNAISFIAGNIIPGAVELLTLRHEVLNEKFNWTGFLAELENS